MNRINVQFTYDFDAVKTFVRYAPDIETLARMILGFYNTMNEDIRDGIFVSPDLEECLRAGGILWRKYR